VRRDNGIGPEGTAGRHDAWPVAALLVVGGWLVISPLCWLPPGSPRAWSAPWAAAWP
jgi:hypothetical protein